MAQEHDLEFSIGVDESELDRAEKKVKGLGDAVEETGHKFDKFTEAFIKDAQRLAAQYKQLEKFAEMAKMAEEYRKFAKAAEAANAALSPGNIKASDNAMKGLNNTLKSVGNTLDMLTGKADRAGASLSKALAGKNVTISMDGMKPQEIQAYTRNLGELQKTAAITTVELDKTSAAMDRLATSAHASNTKFAAGSEQAAQSAEHQAVATEKAGSSAAHAGLMMASLAVNVARANTEILAMSMVSIRALTSITAFAAKAQIVSSVLGVVNIAMATGYLSLVKLQAMFAAIGNAMLMFAAKTIIFARNIDYSKISVGGFVSMLKTAGSGVKKFAGEVRSIDVSPAALDKFGKSVRERLKSNLDTASSSVKNFKNETVSLSQSFEVGEVSLGKMVGKLALIGGAVAGAVIGFKALTASFDAIVTGGMAFQQSMADVSAFMDIDPTGKQADALTAKARNLGQTTQYTAKNAADAMVLLAQAGFTVEQTIESAATVLNVDAAGGLNNLARSAEITSDMMHAFGKSTKELPKVADVIAKTANMASLGVEDYYETAKYAAPIATALGVSMEEMSGAIAVLSQNAVKGSQAGTTLRSMMLRLAAPTKGGINAIQELNDAFEFGLPEEELAQLADGIENVQDAVKNLGVSITDTATGKMRPMENILGDINSAMNKLGMNQSQRAKIIKDLFGVYAYTGSQILLNSTEFADNTGKKLADYTKELENASGASERMAKIRMSSLQGDVRLYESAVSELQLTLYYGMEPALRYVVNSATSGILSLTSSIKFIGGLFSQFVEVVIRAAAPLAVLWQILKNIAGFVADLGSYMARFFGKGLLSGLAPVLETLSMIESAVTAAFLPLANALQPAITAISNIIASLLGLNAAGSDARDVVVLFAGSAHYAGRLLGGFLSTVAEGWGKVLVMLIDLLGVAVRAFVQFSQAVGRSMAQVSMQLADPMAQLMSGLKQGIAPYLKDIAKAFNEFGKAFAAPFAGFDGTPFAAFFQDVLKALAPTIEPLAKIFEGLGKSLQAVGIAANQAGVEVGWLSAAGKYLGTAVGFVLSASLSTIVNAIDLMARTIAAAIHALTVLGKVIGVVGGAIATAFMGEFSFSVFADSLRGVFEYTLSRVQQIDWDKIAYRVIKIVSDTLLFAGVTILSATFGLVMDNVFAHAFSHIAFSKLIVGAFVFVGDALYQSGIGAINAFASGISAGASALWNALLGVFNWIDRLLPHSDAQAGPLSRLSDSGKSAVETFAEGAANAKQGLFAPFVWIGQQIMSALSAGVSGYYGKFKTSLSALISGKGGAGAVILDSISLGITGAMYLAAAAFTNFINAFDDFTVDLYVMAVNFTSRFASAFVGGNFFGDMVGAFGGLVVDALNAVFDLVKNALFNFEMVVMILAAAVLRETIGAVFYEIAYVIKHNKSVKAAVEAIRLLGNEILGAGYTLTKSIVIAMVGLGRNVLSQFPFADIAVRHLNAQMTGMFGSGGKIHNLFNKYFVVKFTESYYGSLERIRFIIGKQVPLVDISSVLLTAFMTRSASKFSNKPWNQIDRVRRDVHANLKAVYDVTNTFAKNQPRVWAAILTNVDEFAYQLAKHFPRLSREIVRLAPFLVAAFQSLIDIFTAVWPKNAFHLRFLLDRMFIQPFQLFVDSLNTALIRLGKSSLFEQFLRMIRAVGNSIPAILKASIGMFPVFARAFEGFALIGLNAITALSQLDQFMLRTFKMGLPLAIIFMDAIVKLFVSMPKISAAWGDFSRDVQDVSLALRAAGEMFYDSIVFGVNASGEASHGLQLLMQVAAFLLMLNPATSGIGIVVMLLSAFEEQIRSLAKSAVDLFVPIQMLFNDLSGVGTKIEGFGYVIYDTSKYIKSMVAGLGGFSVAITLASVLFGMTVPPIGIFVAAMSAAISVIGYLSGQTSLIGDFFATIRTAFESVDFITEFADSINNSGIFSFGDRLSNSFKSVQDSSGWASVALDAITTTVKILAAGLLGLSVAFAAINFGIPIAEAAALGAAIGVAFGYMFLLTDNLKNAWESLGSVGQAIFKSLAMIIGGLGLAVAINPIAPVIIGVVRVLWAFREEIYNLAVGIKKLWDESLLFRIAVVALGAAFLWMVMPVTATGIAFKGMGLVIYSVVGAVIGQIATFREYLLSLGDAIKFVIMAIAAPIAAVAHILAHVTGVAKKLQAIFGDDIAVVIMDFADTMSNVIIGALALIGVALTALAVKWALSWKKMALAKSNASAFINKNPMLLAFGIDQKQVEKNIRKGAKEANEILSGAFGKCKGLGDCVSGGVARGAKNAKQALHGIFAADSISDKIASGVKSGVVQGAASSRGILGRAIFGGQNFSTSDPSGKLKETIAYLNQIEAKQRDLRKTMRDYGYGAVGKTDEAIRRGKGRRDRKTYESKEVTPQFAQQYARAKAELEVLKRAKDAAVKERAMLEGVVRNTKPEILKHAPDKYVEGLIRAGARRGMSEMDVLQKYHSRIVGRYQQAYSAASKAPLFNWKGFVEGGFKAWDKLFTYLRKAFANIVRDPFFTRLSTLKDLQKGRKARDIGIKVNRANFDSMLSQQQAAAEANRLGAQSKLARDIDERNKRAAGIQSKIAVLEKSGVSNRVLAFYKEKLSLLNQGTDALYKQLRVMQGMPKGTYKAGASGVAASAGNGGTIQSARSSAKAGKNPSAVISGFSAFEDFVKEVLSRNEPARLESISKVTNRISAIDSEYLKHVESLHKQREMIAHKYDQRRERVLQAVMKERWNDTPKQFDVLKINKDTGKQEKVGTKMFGVGERVAFEIAEYQKKMTAELQTFVERQHAELKHFNDPKMFKAEADKQSLTRANQMGMQAYAVGNDGKARMTVEFQKLRQQISASLVSDFVERQKVEREYMEHRAKSRIKAHAQNTLIGNIHQEGKFDYDRRLQTESKFEQSHIMALAQKESAYRQFFAVQKQNVLSSISNDKLALRMLDESGALSSKEAEYRKRINEQKLLGLEREVRALHATQKMLKQQSAVYGNQVNAITILEKTGGIDPGDAEDQKKYIHDLQSTVNEDASHISGRLKDAKREIYSLGAAYSDLYSPHNKNSPNYKKQFINVDEGGLRPSQSVYDRSELGKSLSTPVMPVNNLLDKHYRDTLSIIANNQSWIKRYGVLIKEAESSLKTEANKSRIAENQDIIKRHKELIQKKVAANRALRELNTEFSDDGGLYRLRTHRDKRDADKKYGGDADAMPAHHTRQAAQSVRLQDAINKHLADLTRRIPSLTNALGKVHLRPFGEKELAMLSPKTRQDFDQRGIETAGMARHNAATGKTDVYLNERVLMRRAMNENLQTLTHEVGHAWDNYLSDKRGLDHAMFKSMHSQQFAKVSPYAGYNDREGFAEAFRAANHGGGQDVEPMRQLMRQQGGVANFADAMPAGMMRDFDFDAAESGVSRVNTQIHRTSLLAKAAQAPLKAMALSFRVAGMSASFLTGMIGGMALEMGMMFAMQYVFENWEDIAFNLREMWKKLEMEFSAFKNIFLNHYNELSVVVENSALYKSLSSALQEISVYFESVRDSGMALVLEFAAGIEDAAADLWDAVWGVFEQLTELFPHSNAKEGPLSHLYESGLALIQTISDGVLSQPQSLADAVFFAFSKVAQVIPDAASQIASTSVLAIGEQITSINVFLFDSMYDAVQDGMESVSALVGGNNSAIAAVKSELSGISGLAGNIQEPFKSMAKALTIELVPLVFLLSGVSAAFRLAKQSAESLQTVKIDFSAISKIQNPLKGISGSLEKLSGVWESLMMSWAKTSEPVKKILKALSLDIGVLATAAIFLSPIGAIYVTFAFALGKMAYSYQEVIALTKQWYESLSDEQRMLVWIAAGVLAMVAAIAFAIPAITAFAAKLTLAQIWMVRLSMAFSLFSVFSDEIKLAASYVRDMYVGFEELSGGNAIMAALLTSVELLMTGLFASLDALTKIDFQAIGNDVVGMVGNFSKSYDLFMESAGRSAEILKPVFGSLLESIKASENPIIQSIVGLVGSVIDVFNGVNEVIDSFANSWNNLSSVVRKFATGMAIDIAVIAASALMFNPIVSIYIGFALSVVKLAYSFKELFYAFGEWFDTLSDTGKVVTVVSGSFVGLGLSIWAIIPAVTAFVSTLTVAQRRLALLSIVFTLISVYSDDIKQSLTALNQAIDTMSLSPVSDLSGWQQLVLAVTMATAAFFVVTAAIKLWTVAVWLSTAAGYAWRAAQLAAFAATMIVSFGIRLLLLNTIAVTAAQWAATAAGYAWRIALLAMLATSILVSFGFTSLRTAILAATSATTLWGAAIAVITSPITIAVAVVAGFVAIIYLAYTHIKEITDYINSYWPGLGELIAAPFKAMGDIATGVGTAIGEAIAALSMGDWSGAGWIIAAGIANGFASIGTMVWEILSGLVEMLTGYKLPGLDEIGRSITDFFMSVDLFDAGRKIIESLTNGIKSMGGEVVQAMKDTVPGYQSVVMGISDGIEAVFGQADIGQMQVAGQKAAEQFAAGMSNSAAPTQAAAATAQSVMDYFPMSPAKLGAIREIENSGYKFTGQLAEGIKKGETQAIDAAARIAENIMQALKAIGDGKVISGNMFKGMNLDQLQKMKQAIEGASSATAKEYWVQSQNITAVELAMRDLAIAGIDAGKGIDDGMKNAAQAIEGAHKETRRFFEGIEKDIKKLKKEIDEIGLSDEEVKIKELRKVLESGNEGWGAFGMKFFEQKGLTKKDDAGKEVVDVERVQKELKIAESAVAQKLAFEEIKRLKEEQVKASKDLLGDEFVLQKLRELGATEQDATYQALLQQASATKQITDEAEKIKKAKQDAAEAEKKMAEAQEKAQSIIDTAGLSEYQRKVYEYTKEFSKAMGAEKGAALGKQSADAEFYGEMLTQVTQKLQEANAAINTLGMNESQKQIYDLEQKYGTELVNNNMALIERATRQSALAKAAEDYYNAQQDIATANMTDTQKAVYDKTKAYGGDAEAAREVVAMERQRDAAKELAAARKELDWAGYTDAQRGYLELAEKIGAAEAMSALQTKQAAEMRRNSVAKLNELRDRQAAAGMSEGAKGYYDQIKDVDPATRKQIMATEAATKAIEDQRQAWDDVGNAAADSLEKIATGEMSLKDGLKDFAKQLQKSLMQDQIKKLKDSILGNFGMSDEQNQQSALAAAEANDKRRAEQFDVMIKDVDLSFGNTIADKTAALAKGMGETIQTAAAQLNTQVIGAVRKLSGSIDGLTNAFGGKVAAAKSGGVAAGNLGYISAGEESGKRGVLAVSSGRGDPGGVSYGAHQLASNTGTMQAFLKSVEGAGYGALLKGLKIGSAEFSQQYLQIAQNDGTKFAQAQESFIKRTHYDPLESYASKFMDTGNRAVQEMLYSASVQHGKASKVVDIFVERTKGQTLSIDDTVKEFYAARTEYVQGLKDLPAETKSALTARYEREMNSVLDLAHGMGGGMQQAGQAAIDLANVTQEPMRALAGITAPIEQGSNAVGAGMMQAANNAAQGGEMVGQGLLSAAQNAMQGGNLIAQGAAEAAQKISSIASVGAVAGASAESSSSNLISILGGLGKGSKQAGSIGAAFGAGANADTFLGGLASGAKELFKPAMDLFDSAKKTVGGLTDSLGLTGPAGMFKDISAMPWADIAGIGMSLLQGDARGAVSAVGGMIGQAVIPIPVIGGMIGKFVTDKLVSNIWGKKKVVGSGVEMNLSGGEMSGRTFEEWEKKRFFKKKTGFDYKEFDAEQQKAMTQFEDQFGKMLRKVNQDLGTTMSLEGIDLNVKSKKDESMQDFMNRFAGETLKAAIGNLGKDGTVLNGFTQTLKDIVTAAADATGEEVTAIVQQMSSIRTAFNAARLNADNLSMPLIEAGGGLESFAGSVQFFADNFTSEQDRLVGYIKSMSPVIGDTLATLSDSTGTLPRTREEFAALVRGLDLTTASGQELFNTLMSNTQAMDSYYKGLEFVREKFGGENPTAGTSQSNADAAFAALGVELPKTRAEFYNLVMGLDTTNEAARNLQVNLLGLAPSMDSYYAQAEAFQKAYNDAFLSGAGQLSEGVQGVVDVFVKAGVEIPTSQAGYQSLIDSLMAGGEQQQEQGRQLMALYPQWQENFTTFLLESADGLAVFTGNLLNMRDSIGASDIGSMLMDSISNAKNANEAGQLFAAEFEKAFANQMINTVVNTVAQMVMNSIVGPMIQASAISSGNTVIASANAGGMLTGASAAGSTMLTTGATTGATALMAGGQIAGDYLAQVVGNVKAVIGVMSAVMKDPEIKSMLAGLNPAMQDIGAATYTAIKPMQSYVTSADDLRDSLTKTGDAAGDAAGGVDEANDAFKKFHEEALKRSSTMGDSEYALKKLEQTYSGLNGIQLASAVSARDLALTMAGWTESQMNAMTQSKDVGLDAITDPVAALASKQKEAIIIAQELAAKTEGLSGKQGRQVADLEKLSTSTETLTLEQLADDMLNLQEIIKGLQESFGEFHDKVSQVATGMGDTEIGIGKLEKKYAGLNVAQLASSATAQQLAQSMQTWDLQTVANVAATFGVSIETLMEDATGLLDIIGQIGEATNKMRSDIDAEMTNTPDNVRQVNALSKKYSTDLMQFSYVKAAGIMKNASPQELMDAARAYGVSLETLTEDVVSYVQTMKEIAKDTFEPAISAYNDAMGEIGNIRNSIKGDVLSIKEELKEITFDTKAKDFTAAMDKLNFGQAASAATDYKNALTASIQAQIRSADDAGEIQKRIFADLNNAIAAAEIYRAAIIANIDVQIKGVEDQREAANKAHEDQMKIFDEEKQAAQELLDSIKDFRTGLREEINKLKGDTSLTDVSFLMAQMQRQGGKEQLETAGRLKDLILSNLDDQIKKQEELGNAQIETQKKLLDFAKDLRGFVDDLKLSDKSPLTNAQRLAESQRQYMAALAGSRTGDEAAMQKLQGAASTYLQEARGYYASSAMYTGIFDTVTGELSGLASQIEMANATAPTAQLTNTVFQAEIDRLKAAAIAQLETIDTTLAAQARNQEAILARTPPPEVNQAYFDNLIVGIRQSAMAQVLSINEALKELELGLTTTLGMDLVELGAGIGLDVGDVNTTLGLIDTGLGTNLGAVQDAVNGLAPTVSAVSQAVSAAAGISDQVIRDYINKVITDNGGLNAKSIAQIKAAADANGISAAQIANAVGVDTNTVSGLLNGVKTAVDNNTAVTQRVGNAQIQAYIDGIAQANNGALSNSNLQSIYSTAIATGVTQRDIATAYGVSLETVQAIFASANIPAFAEGGIVNSPVVGLVGEAGPEAIVPLKQYHEQISRAGDKDSDGETEALMLEELKKLNARIAELEQQARESNDKLHRINKTQDIQTARLEKSQEDSARRVSSSRESRDRR